MRQEQAVELARRFHDGATDKAGLPYLDHVLRVADRVESHDEKLTAILHDLLEDTELTRTDLGCTGCPPRVVEAVEAMTRQPEESYEDFLRRAAANPIARVVKLADIADNADEERLALLDAATAERLRTKYQRARALLEQLAPPDPTPSFETEAASICVPEEPNELAATFWCDVCGHPAGTLALVDWTNPDGIFKPGYHLTLQTFLGSMAPSVDDDDLEEVRGALRTGDVRYFRRQNWELTPFWCPTCEQVFCRAHWVVETTFDDGFFDAFYGTCPKGHRHELWD